MKVYLATCLERRQEACDLAGLLRDAGHEVVSRWHDGDATRAQEDALDAAGRRAIADANFWDLDRAQALIWLADARGRGSLIELGYAIAALDCVIAVGDPADVTLMAAPSESPRWVPDVAAAVAALEDT